MRTAASDGQDLFGGMVTHEKELAHRVPRKIEIIDGYVTHDEYLGIGDWAGH